MAEGPILFRGIENVDEHVLRPDAGAFAEQLRDPPEQRLVLSPYSVGPGETVPLRRADRRLEQSSPPA